VSRLFALQAIRDLPFLLKGKTIIGGTIAVIGVRKDVSNAKEVSIMINSSIFNVV
jgi:hypothetical protein